MELAHHVVVVHHMYVQRLQSAKEIRYRFGQLIIIGLVNIIHILNNFIISQQKLLPEEMSLTTANRKLRYQLPHVIKNNIPAILLQISIKRSINESHMNLLLYDLKLLLISLRSNLAKCLRNLGLAYNQYPLELKVSA